MNSKIDDEIVLEKLEETKNIIIKKHKEFTKRIRRVKIAMKKLYRILGEYGFVK